MRSLSLIAVFGVLSWFLLNEQLRMHLQGFSWNGIAVGIAVTIVAFVIEAITLGWSRSSARKMLSPGPSQKRDLAIFLFDVTHVWHLLGWIATLGLLTFLGSELARVMSQWTDGSLRTKIPSVILQAVILAVVYDFMSYWQHRAFHYFPALWEIHKYHHTATDLAIVTARRDHFLISPFFGLTFAVPSIVLGHMSGHVWWISGALGVHGLLTHSGIRSHWGFLGRYVLLSPEAHRVHHSAEQEHYDRNFGALTPLWDRIFGTYYDPARILDSGYKLGVEGELHNHHHLFQEMDNAAGRALRALWPKRFKSAKIAEAQRESGAEVRRVVG